MIKYKKKVIDSTNVYWTDYCSGCNWGVYKVSINGGTVTTLASGLNGPQGIVVDSTSIYWIEMGGSNWGNGTVKKGSEIRFFTEPALIVKKRDSSLHFVQGQNSR